MRTCAAISRDECKEEKSGETFCYCKIFSCLFFGSTKYRVKTAKNSIYNNIHLKNESKLVLVWLHMKRTVFPTELREVFLNEEVS